MFDLREKKVIVVGLGTSGAAAARLCLARGAHVVGTDAKSVDALSEGARALAEKGADLRGGGIDKADFIEADLIVVSPGVASFPALEAAEKAGIHAISEIELAYRCNAYPCPVVAIGGTNGKSTVTSLVAALLEGAGKKVFAGGNLGEPWSDHVDEELDVVVLEVSSFQMERIDMFHPNVAALLNVTPDHLDRYDSLEAYAHAKGSFFLRQGAHDVAVVPANDEVCAEQARRGRGRIVTFGPGGDRVVTEEFPGLRGGHSRLNTAAALAVVDGLGKGLVADDVVTRVFSSFRSLPHRMELVATIDGVAYYDDSKGTNVGATVTALEGMREGRAVLVAGGKDKGGSYEPLVAALEKRGRAVVTIGEAAGAIEAAIGHRIAFERSSSIDDAVLRARRLAHEGDAVLLSPACSSFDMFKDYKQRGDAFVSAVRALEKTAANVNDSAEKRA